MMKNFSDLTEREVLAVAISSEEEDGRIYMSFTEDLKERYPDTAKLFEEMAVEERGTAIVCSRPTKTALERIFRRYAVKTSGVCCAGVPSG
jgi:hypothetical protein